MAGTMKIHTPTLLTLAALLGMVSAGCEGGYGNTRRAAPEQTASRVDSVFPIEEEIRRFRATVAEEASSLSGGAESREALVRGYVDALERADTAALRQLALTRAEFAYLYYPHTRYARRPYQMSPALVWFQMENYAGRGLSRALNRHGGEPLGYTGHRCEQEATEGPNRIWSACAIERARPDGSAETLLLLGRIVERDGHFKFVSLANRL
jgi:hypothetical protein